jgi:hypothetical protein
MPPPVDPPSGHSGDYGIHQLIDSSEYPGLICRWESAELVSMRVRQAIAFAKNLTPGTDQQGVKRRLVVQYTDSTSEPYAWVALPVLPATSASATDKRNAAFRSVVVSLNGDGPDHLRWRVVQRLIWSSPAGRVNETARYVGVYQSTFIVPGQSCTGLD